MGHPDGPVAQRLAQGKQDGGLEGPQGPLAVDPTDEIAQRGATLASISAGN
jgi:hypothetical protein